MVSMDGTVDKSSYFEDKYNQLLRLTESLKRENHELKQILKAHGIDYTPQEPATQDKVFSSIMFPTVQLPLNERLWLFCSLFKGRESFR